MGKNDVTIRILGEPNHVKKVFAEVADAGSSMATKFSGVGKKIGLAFAGGITAVAVGVGAIVSGGIRDVVNLERISAQTEAAIRSTGGAARVSGADIASLAERIEALTGIEQEGVREGANLLLTFTNIRNGVGKGNDVFNQATRTLTDMSVALGTDVSASAVQLGKALNDPIAGVSALTKVGVTFTDQQKKQIKALVDSGDVMSAQKIILAELNTEFGGSAAAFGDTTAGKLAKFRNSLGDIGEEIATRLLPVGESLLGWAADKLPAAMGAISGVVEDIALGIDVFVTTWKDPDVTSDGWVGVVEKVAGSLRHLFDDVAVVAGKVKQFVDDNPFPVLAGVLTVVVVPVVVALAGALFGVVTSAAAVVVGVGLLVGGLVWAYEHFDLLHGAVDGIIGIGGELVEHWDTLRPLMLGIGLVIATVMIPHWVSLGVAALVSGGQQVAAWVMSKVQAVGAVLAHSLAVVTMVGGWVAMGVAALAGAAQVALAWLISMGPIALVVAAVIGLVAVVIANWETIKNAITGAARAVIDFLSANWPLILAILTGPIGLAVLAIAKNWDSIKAGAAAAKDWVVDRFDDLVGFVTGLPGRISAGAGGMFDGIKNAFRAALNWIIDRWNGLEFKLPEIDTHIPGVGKVGGFTLGTPDIPRLEQGALVRGGRGGTLALIGEGARDEIVQPLPSRWRLDDDGDDPRGAMAYRPQVVVNARTDADPWEIGRELAWVLKTA